jgi:hypothetical protein
MAVFTRRKLGSKRLCKPIINFTPASLHALIASTVSAKSVAMGFSQKTCFPFAAHALIWSAWNCDGEQIHTASTSGSVITSMASAVNFGTPNVLAAMKIGDAAVMHDLCSEDVITISLVTSTSAISVYLPFSAFDIVGLDTMTGMTPGALLIAPKWTMPMRPQPMTPTLTGSFDAESVVIGSAIERPAF